MKNPYSFPLFLTLFRLLIAPPIFIIFLPRVVHSIQLQSMLFSLFVVTALTDYFDGFLARRWKQESFIGTLLDPFADKVFLTSLIIPLVYLHRMPVFIAFCIIIRELWVTSLRESASLMGKRINVQNSGKIKTCVQLFYVGWLMMGMMIPLPYDAAITYILMSATLIITFYSGYEYTRNYIQFVF
jgi:CDP-diacylglycerol--glycerol-3-phosphate 3-phosphatidyltransferase